MAVNCCVSPFATDGLAGVTAIDCSVAAITVIVVDPLTVLRVALIKLVPTATALASPPVVIVTCAGVPDCHVTVAERSCVLLSE